MRKKCEKKMRKKCKFWKCACFTKTNFQKLHCFCIFACIFACIFFAFSWAKVFRVAFSGCILFTCFLHFNQVWKSLERARFYHTTLLVSLFFSFAIYYTSETFSTTACATMRTNYSCTTACTNYYSYYVLLLRSGLPPRLLQVLHYYTPHYCPHHSQTMGPTSTTTKKYPCECSCSHAS